MTEVHPMAPRQNGVTQVLLPPARAAAMRAAQRVRIAQRDAAAPGYESMARQPYGSAYDAGMLARHEHRAQQRPPAGPGLDRAAAELELRYRQLELLLLTGG